MMQGERHDMHEGQWGLVASQYGKNLETGEWFCCTPNGHLGRLTAHEVTEHQDGAITVSPSILVSDDTGELWHGYLEHGIWREV